MNDTDLTEFNATGDYAVGTQLGYLDKYLNVLFDLTFSSLHYVVKVCL